MHRTIRKASTRRIRSLTRAAGRYQRQALHYPADFTVAHVWATWAVSPQPRHWWWQRLLVRIDRKMIRLQRLLIASVWYTAQLKHHVHDDREKYFRALAP